MGFPPIADRWLGRRQRLPGAGGRNFRAGSARWRIQESARAAAQAFPEPEINDVTVDAGSVPARRGRVNFSFAPAFAPIGRSRPGFSVAVAPGRAADTGCKPPAAGDNILKKGS